MSATVITMASAKGGSGKTIITAGFATMLAAIGRRVLMIDTDAATNGLSLFYIGLVGRESRASSIGLLEAAAGDGEPDGALNYTRVSENLWLLPATYSFRNTEEAHPALYGEVLSDFLQEARADFDYIFLDAQSGSDVFAEIATESRISDQVVIVSEYDPMSAAGVERLKAIFSSSLTYPRTWVLLNKMLPEFIKSFKDFMEIAKYLSPLPWSADVVRAYARRSLPVNMNSGNEYTLAAIQSIRPLLDEKTVDELEIWLKDRSIEIKDPINSELREAQAELSLLRGKRESLRRRRMLYELLTYGATAVAAVVSISVYSITSHVNLSNIIPIVTVALVALFGGITPILKSFPSGINGKKGSSSSDLESEINSLNDRVRRLRDLSSLDLEDLIRRSE